MTCFLKKFHAFWQTQEKWGYHTCLRSLTEIISLIQFYAYTFSCVINILNGTQRYQQKRQFIIMSIQRGEYDIINKKIILSYRTYLNYHLELTHTSSIFRLKKYIFYPSQEMQKLMKILKCPSTFNSDGRTISLKIIITIMLKAKLETLV